MRKISIFAFVLFLTAGTVTGVFYVTEPASTATITAATPPKTIESAPPAQQSPAKPIKQQPLPPREPAKLSGTLDSRLTAYPTLTAINGDISEQLFDVPLHVMDVTYTASVAENATVIDAMRTLDAADFAFSGREYPGLGFFLESINGTSNEDGYYWILYVNGKTSQLGASSVSLHEGDVIEWRYEKGY